MKKKTNKKKKWEVKFHPNILEKLEDIPDDVAEEFEKIIIGFKSGEIDPTKAGQPVEWIELNTKLKCPKCGSKEVEWLLDKNSDEVTFHCLMCSEGFWMTYKEYKNAIRKNKDSIIEES